MPLAGEWVEEAAVALPVKDGPFLTLFGRHFIPVQMPLPLGWTDSPIQLRLWIEIVESDVQGIRSVLTGERRSFSSSGTMACDVPGFPGSIGSPCRYRYRGHGQEAQITFCADRRIDDLDEDPGHAGMAALYRRIWGNDTPVKDFDPDLQQAMVEGWGHWLGRQAYARDVGPPPQMAGMNPGKVIVAPPLDTDQPAILATIGCSDLPGAGNRHYELTCAVRNPSDDFISCFGEFAYLTRMNRTPIGPSAIVPERRGIPDSDDMVAWLLADPWWDEPAPENVLDGKQIEHLIAVPIYATEMAFAAMYGPEALMRAFRDIDPDLASLNREPVVVETDG
jgi:hypothetical protein